MIPFFEEIVFDFVEFLAVNLHCDLVFVFVNIILATAVDFGAHSLQRNPVEGRNDAFGNFLAFYFLDRVNHTVRMVLFDHGQILSFHIDVAQSFGIDSLRVTQHLIIFS